MDRKKPLKLRTAVSDVQQHLSSWSADTEEGLRTLKRVNEYGPSVGGE